MKDYTEQLERIATALETLVATPKPPDHTTVPARTKSCGLSVRARNVLQRWEQAYPAKRMRDLNPTTLIHEKNCAEHTIDEIMNWKVSVMEKFCNQ